MLVSCSFRKFRRSVDFFGRFRMELWVGERGEEFVWVRVIVIWFLGVEILYAGKEVICLSIGF